MLINSTIYRDTIAGVIITHSDVACVTIDALSYFPAHGDYEERLDKMSLRQLRLLSGAIIRS